MYFLSHKNFWPLYLLCVKFFPRLSIFSQIPRSLNSSLHTFALARHQYFYLQILCVSFFILTATDFLISIPQNIYWFLCIQKDPWISKLEASRFVRILGSWIFESLNLLHLEAAISAENERKGNKITYCCAFAKKHYALDAFERA